jgi:hypothetical protein
LKTNPLGNEKKSSLLAFLPLKDTSSSNLWLAMKKERKKERKEGRKKESPIHTPATKFSHPSFTTTQ